MKYTVFFKRQLRWTGVIVLVVVMLSCNIIPEPKVSPGNGFSVVIGGELLLDKENIDYYDFSAHIIYLKDGFCLEGRAADDSRFWVLSGQTTLYEGLLNPDNYIEDSVYWSNQAFIFDECYPENLVRINYNLDFKEIYDQVYDPRNETGIVDALKADDLFHCGLNCTVDTIIRNESGGVTLILELINNDSFNYYYFDPAKMDFNEYHYFTNGLSLYQWSPFARYDNHVSPVTPEMSPCCWGEDWVSLIPSGETRHIELIYEQFDQVPPGEYCAVFRFHGESIKPAEGSTLFESGKMWLGDLVLAQKVHIE